MTKQPEIKFTKVNIITYIHLVVRRSAISFLFHSFGYYLKLFIDSQFVDSVNGKTFAAINPSTGKKLCDVTEGDKVRITFPLSFQSLSIFLRLPHITAHLLHHSLLVTCAFVKN